ncbi:McrC family protein [Salinibacterium sp. NK8237]|uniref:McrC family protein n=1 Tax=Salinibacterium sp. NK8237 TaxID=2792038 RepID=UPI0018CEA304|nr:hypothetical protein [Salinibacterium sp. NK8237]MBH0130560.1 hypothetical protein [Salinibacterium sp. NK8237]
MLLQGPEGLPFVLKEAHTEDDVDLDSATAAAISNLGIAAVMPVGPESWRITNIRRVGTVRLGSREVRIASKVPVAQLFHLLAVGQQWGEWHQDIVKLDQATDLYPAVSEAFSAVAAQALSGGVLRDYCEVQSAEPTIRGRWLVGEQIRRRHGLPLPAELQYDEYTANIPANRLIRSAARRLLGLGGISLAARARVMQIDRMLGEADLLIRGDQIPVVQHNRNTERYRAVLGLARLILTGGSLDHRVGGFASAGFLLDLAAVFESFVEHEMRRSAARFGGSIVGQDVTGLDVDGKVEIRPDIVWKIDGQVRAVFDAKYKAEKPAGFPNADIYQMLAYCIRHNVQTGHLVYAAGNEMPARYTIAQAGITVVCHALDLDRSPDELSAQIDRIVEAALPAGNGVA